MMRNILRLSLSKNEEKRNTWNSMWNCNWKLMITWYNGECIKLQICKIEWWISSEWIYSVNTIVCKLHFLAYLPLVWNSKVNFIVLDISIQYTGYDKFKSGNRFSLFLNLCFSQFFFFNNKLNKKSHHNFLTNFSYFVST